MSFKNKNLLILGAGQYGTVVKEIAKSLGCFERIDFLDNSFGIKETEGDYRENSIGKLAEYEKFINEYTYGIIAIKNAETRRVWTEKLIEACYKIPILVSPKAFVGNTSQLSCGVVVEPMAVVHENVAIGVGTFVSSGAVVNHNSFVADYCHIDNNAVISSGVLLPPMTYVGPHEIINEAYISNLRMFK